MPRKLKGATMEGYAIFNHVGSPWSASVWPERIDAETHLISKRKELAERRWGDLSRHSVQRVRLVISPATEPAKT